MAQEILLKRNTNDVTLSGLPQGESAAYTYLNQKNHKIGQPVVVLYNPASGDNEYSKVHGTGNTVAAIYAIGTGNGKGMYQAFSTIEDMLAVQSQLGTLNTNFTNFKNEVLTTSNSFDGSATSLFTKITVNNKSYIRANFDFFSTGTISMGELDTEGGTGGGGGAVAIKIKVGDKEFPLENGIIELDDYYTKSEMDTSFAKKTYVDNAILNAKDTRVDTLVGTDTNKSVRDISKLAVAELLSEAPEDFDTLIEIAEYLETHSDDAVAMNNAIEALKKITKHFYNNGTVTENSIKNYIDNAIKGLSEGDIATALSAINTLKAIKITAGNGLSGGGDLEDTEITLSVKANGTSINVSSNGIKVNYDTTSLVLDSSNKLSVGTIDGGLF